MVGEPPGLGGQWLPIAVSLGMFSLLDEVMWIWSELFQGVDESLMRPAGLDDTTSRHQLSSMGGSAQSQSRNGTSIFPLGSGEINTQSHARAASINGGRSQHGRNGVLQSPPGLGATTQIMPWRTDGIGKTHGRRISISGVIGGSTYAQHPPVESLSGDQDRDEFAVDERTTPSVRTALYDIRALQFRQQTATGDRAGGPSTPGSALSSGQDVLGSVPPWRRATLPLQFGDMPTPTRCPTVADHGKCGSQVELMFEALQSRQRPAGGWGDLSTVPRSGPHAKCVLAATGRSGSTDQAPLLEATTRSPSGAPSSLNSQSYVAVGLTTIGRTASEEQKSDFEGLSPRILNLELEAARERDQFLRESADLTEVDMSRYQSYLYPDNPQGTTRLHSVGRFLESLPP